VPTAWSCTAGTTRAAPASSSYSSAGRERGSRRDALRIEGALRSELSPSNVPTARSGAPGGTEHDDGQEVEATAKRTLLGCARRDGGQPDAQLDPDGDRGLGLRGGESMI